MSVEVSFETHSLSVDNERGVATGWLHGELSDEGRRLAAELGARHRDDGATAVLTSDLRRAAETAELAFDGDRIPILRDWRLRECDYGDLNGSPADVVHGDRLRHVDLAYPGGESWRHAVARVDRCLDDVLRWWDGGRVVVIGHVATKWALDRRVHDVPLEELAAAPFEWREGWSYLLSS